MTTFEIKHLQKLDKRKTLKILTNESDLITAAVEKHDAACKEVIRIIAALCRFLFFKILL